ncbi:MAG: hypothetical protein AMK71_10045 [Nitrospira bacterium SG8_35_4]|nr:MAG: hypothetical protein AMK71_10045 [Nitrospira bacterium SG8_35_4]
MTELDKLRHLLKHWMEHNDAHVSTYDEWARKAAAMGENDLSDILKEITCESRKLNNLFQKALESI